MDEANNQEEKPAPGASSSGTSEKNIGTKNENENILPEQQPGFKHTLSENAVELINDTKRQPEILQPSTENFKAPASQEHHSKKWTHYLFDFVMLFLAITAGFFVDNKREYYIEHQRAGQFSKQLLADLRQDSSLFEKRNGVIRSMQKGFDHLIYMLTQNTGATNREVLETLLPLAYVFDIPATTTTYDQMKASGSLRYIENMELTAHLQDYYDVLLPRSINIAMASLDYYTGNINPYYLKHIRIQDYDPFNDTLLNKNPVIMGRTSQTDQELANIMGNYGSLLKIQVTSMNNPALDKIKETIGLLKDEYNLK